MYSEIKKIIDQIVYLFYHWDENITFKKCVTSDFSLLTALHFKTSNKYNLLICERKHKSVGVHLVEHKE